MVALIASVQCCCVVASNHFLINKDLVCCAGAGLQDRVRGRRLLLIMVVICIEGPFVEFPTRSSTISPAIDRDPVEKVIIPKRMIVVGEGGGMVGFVGQKIDAAGEVPQI